MFRLFGLAARNAARDTMRKAVLGLAAALCLVIGLGFLVAAGWTALAAAKGPLLASVFVALGFLALAAILMVAASARSRPRALARDFDEEALAALSRAAGGEPGEMERTMRTLLSQAGLTPPETGGAAALLSAFVFGLVLALTRGRR